MLIIHPPLTKGCEPPAALAYLSAALTAHGEPCTLCDMNIEGLEYLLHSAQPAADTWSARAFNHLDSNLATLRSLQGYSNVDRYRRAIADINRVMAIAGNSQNLQLSLGNYQDNGRSPLSSADLRLAAAEYRKNIFFPYFSTRIDELCDQENPSHIGFSLSYLSQALCTFAMIGYLRARHPHRRIVVGGGLVTTWLSNPDWCNPFADLVDSFFAGPGEAPLLQLLGLAQKAEHVRPDYRQLHRYPYLAPGFILPYTTSSGCFWKKCNFCPETSENNRYHQVPAESVVADLQGLVRETSPVLIHLLDNAISPGTLRALTEHPPGAPWYGFVRIEDVLADRDFCHRLRAAGCVMLKLGLESGDQDVLDSMNKGIDLNRAAIVLENLRAAGIASYVYLLFGTPTETLPAAERTRQFIEEHHQAIGYLNLAIFNLPIGSEATTRLAITDFYSGDLSIYRSFTHPLGWNRAEVRRYLDAVFKRSPTIAEILRRDPPFFTSNHAPFMQLVSKDEGQF
ncbi:MAG: radical SAM protein [Desulforhopalus sp.]|nr:radical SAM protein [Desulforhopalus sp.]